MASRRIYHVLRDNGYWKVQKENAARASRVCVWRPEAIAAARELAKAAGSGDVVVHKPDGDIEIEFTYGRGGRVPRE